MKHAAFRTYDIRGIVGSELSLDRMYEVGLALGYFFAQDAHNPVQTIAIGRDGRTHSPAIYNELVRALCDSNYHVVDLGLCPTPVLYFSQYALSINAGPIDAGIMITASHNDKEYNGIKPCRTVYDQKTNQKISIPVWGDDVQKIYTYFTQKLYVHGASHEKKGAITSCDANSQYIAWLANHFSHLKNSPIAGVVDCAHGATSVIMPELKRVLNWPNIEIICSTLDGTFSHHKPDPTVFRNVQDLWCQMRSKNYSWGIGLDGDGDRMACVTNKGELLLGDKLLAIFAQELLKKHPNCTVLHDSKASDGLISLLSSWGAVPQMVPTGHPFMKEGIRMHNALLGGELSCHFVFKDRYFGYDDGIYAALRLIELLHAQPSILDSVLNQFPHRFSSPEFRIPCDEQVKQAILQKVNTEWSKHPHGTVSRIDGIRFDGPDGWILLRASQTSPAITVRFESKTAEGYDQLMQELTQQLSPFFGADTSIIAQLQKPMADMASFLEGKENMPCAS